MNCASGSVVLPAEEPPRAAAAPLDLPAGAGEASGDTPEEGECRGSGSESGAAGGDKPETRSVCSSSESGSGGHAGGAGPICKICFQGPEQVRRGAGGGRPAPRTPSHPRLRGRALSLVLISASLPGKNRLPWLCEPRLPLCELVVANAWGEPEPAQSFGGIQGFCRVCLARWVSSGARPPRFTSEGLYTIRISQVSVRL